MGIDSLRGSETAKTSWTVDDLENGFLDPCKDAFLFLDVVGSVGSSGACGHGVPCNAMG